MCNIIIIIIILITAHLNEMICFLCVHLFVALITARVPRSGLSTHVCAIGRRLCRSPARRFPLLIPSCYTLVARNYRI